ncbi:DNA-binding protein [Escherichia coli]|nr:DNA-binding protein [Escherichia coli]
MSTIENDVKTANNDISLRTYLERSGNGARKSNGLVINPAVVEEEEGFNTRTAGIGESYYSLPHVVAHLNSLKESYKHDPLSVPAIVVQILNGRPVLRQGACRIRAYAMANIELAEEGRELISLIRCEEFRGSRASAEQFTLDGNSNLALSVVAEALSIKRMVEDAEEPKTFAELAKRRGKTEQHLRQMVRVLDLPEALQVMLVTGEVSMYVALDEYLYSGDKAVNNITKAIDVYGKATAKTLKFVKAGNIDASMQPKAPVVPETNTPETTVTEQASGEGTTEETPPPQLVDGNVGTNPEPTPEPKAKDPIKTPEPKAVSVASVLNKKTVTTIADTAIPLFSRIAEEAKQRAAKNLCDDTYTLVLTNDEMNAICEAHGDLTQYLRKHAEKQNKGQA